MAQVRPLSKPPIQEALIDLVLSGDAVSKDRLQELSTKVLPGGWQEGQIDSVEAEFNSGSSGEMLLLTRPKQFEGFTQRSPDEHRVFQIRPNRLTASHVRSYDSWERLEADAALLLEGFTAQFGPRRIVRMAARFINRIRLPDCDGRGLAALLTRPPLPPEGVETVDLSDFLSQQVLRGLPSGLTANVGIGTSGPLAGEDFTSLVVDVDVFKDCDEDATFQAVDGQLAEIRGVKNALFFGSLQEKALEPYQ